MDREFSIRPVVKPPRSKFYLYVYQVCSECGSIHVYRKVGGKVKYLCTEVNAGAGQPSLFPSRENAPSRDAI